MITHQLKKFDNSFLNRKTKLIAGVDEAGRGPLAGPVVAAAVIFKKNVWVEGVNDSKKLTAKAREKLYYKIIDSAVCFGIGIVDHEEIDRINILQASLKSMKYAVAQLSVKPDLILIDGNKSFVSDPDISVGTRPDISVGTRPDMPVPPRHGYRVRLAGDVGTHLDISVGTHVQAKTIIKGDSKSFAIAAASIIAKVTRDRMMNELAKYFPEYSWDTNKGYPTKSHISAIKKFGVTEFHRKTFLKKMF